MDIIKRDCKMHCPGNVKFLQNQCNGCKFSWHAKFAGWCFKYKISLSDVRRGTFLPVGWRKYMVKIASPDTAFFIKVVPEKAIFDL